MGIRINKNSAEPGSYNFKGSFEEHKKGTFFGPGREVDLVLEVGNGNE